LGSAFLFCFCQEKQSPRHIRRIRCRKIVRPIGVFGWCSSQSQLESCQGFWRMPVDFCSRRLTPGFSDNRSRNLLPARWPCPLYWRCPEPSSTPISGIYRGRSRDSLRSARFRFPTSGRESRFARRPAGSSVFMVSSSPHWEHFSFTNCECVQQLNLYRLRKSDLFCHSERSEESLLG